MESLAQISIDQIDASGRIRSASPEQVEALKESILTVGLLNPITLCRLGEKSFKLVAGGNRLEAYKAAGYHEIPANVVGFTAPEAIIAECDENLCGPNLSPAERALFTAKRKAAYEELHPGTQHGGDRPSRQVGDLPFEDTLPPDNPPAESTQVQRFSAATAQATGFSERAVQRDAERGQKVVPEALDMVKGTKLDTGAYLDKLKNLPAEEQVQQVQRDKEKAASPTIQPPPSTEDHRPTFEEMRAAIHLLCDMHPDEIRAICPPNKRAAMCSSLSLLSKICDQVIEGATA
ncbi:ParB/RepB/Spo0J family partition protein [Agrobacterium cavarae]|uniref:ParB/RepB/Spo0J family partition protein n=1 Tax=Agrobacterium cavarae TaxID=2528239 RepID=UPI00289DF6DF|nr:ParB N-terminal domain-containing protein [Agrobacterium cavarae]